MLRKHHSVNLPLRGGIFLQNSCHSGVGLNDLCVAECDFLSCLRVIGGLLRHASAAHQGLAPSIHALFLLIADFGPLALGPCLRQVGGSLLLGRFALLNLGALRIFVEFRKEDPRVPIKELHKMSVAQMRKEMSLHPLRWVETIDVLPQQHIIVFRKTK